MEFVFSGTFAKKGNAMTWWICGYFFEDIFYDVHPDRSRILFDKEPVKTGANVMDDLKSYEKTEYPVVPKKRIILINPRKL